MITSNILPDTSNDFLTARPFPHIVIDNFFTTDLALILAEEFPKSESDAFNARYNNQLELKNTCNIWDRFPPTTYKVFSFLNSQTFRDKLEDATGIPGLIEDPGLHGAGLHSYPSGGKLNIHIDSHTHAKLGLCRTLNLIVFLNIDWKKEFGGELGLYGRNEDGAPTQAEALIEPVFNRAVIFDTRKDCWHGLATPNRFPTGTSRNSLAVYYFKEDNEPGRKRALFYPNKDQQNNSEILQLIKERAGE